MKYKSVRIRETDHLLIGALQANLRERGIDRLDGSARKELEGGATAGAVIAAALELLRSQLETVTPSAPARAARR